MTSSSCPNSFSASFNFNSHFSFSSPPPQSEADRTWLKQVSSSLSFPYSSSSSSSSSTHWLDQVFSSSSFSSSLSSLSSPTSSSSTSSLWLTGSPPHLGADGLDRGCVSLRRRCSVETLPGREAPLGQVALVVQAALSRTEASPLARPVT